MEKIENQKTKKYLIFRLDENYYALGLQEVKEVVEFNQCTPLPSSPHYMLGVINLRGKVISAIDLKSKIKNCVKGPPPRRQVIIIVDFNQSTIGVVVDSVSEVLAIGDESIESEFELSTEKTKDNVYEGIARFKDRPMILIFNLQKTLQYKDMAIAA